MVLHNWTNISIFNWHFNTLLSSKLKRHCLNLFCSTTYTSLRDIPQFYHYHVAFLINYYGGNFVHLKNYGTILSIRVRGFLTLFSLFLIPHRPPPPSRVVLNIKSHFHHHCRHHPYPHISPPTLSSSPQISHHHRLKSKHRLRHLSCSHLAVTTIVTAVLNLRSYHHHRRPHSQSSPPPPSPI